MRRKGERRIPITFNVWSDSHPIARAISEGDHWLYAWSRRSCIHLQALSKRTGMDVRRFDAIHLGDRVSRAEVDALAIALAVSSADLIASIGDRNEIVE